MKTMRPTATALFALALSALTIPANAAVHIWEKQEVTLTSARSFPNPYTDVTVWVDLTGPNFKKRVYGFWDGSADLSRARARHRARNLDLAKRLESSGPGTRGQIRLFRRHRLDRGRETSRTPYAEASCGPRPITTPSNWPTARPSSSSATPGTPPAPIASNGMTTIASVPSDPGAGFKDYVRYRKAQGYNWVNIIAAFPNWMTDGQSWHVVMDDPEHTTVRSAWLEFGTGDSPRTGSAKNMDNEGGRPFVFPGKVPGYENMFPNVDRVNPEYFRYVDRKIDYLNAQGFVPLIEVSRRDASLLWKKYYGWPDSYARFIQYIWSRYQANNTVLSPIHLDIISESVGPDDYVAAIKVVMEKFGPPPFGTLLSSNANPSTLENWGEGSWVTLQQTGNMREHNNYWYLTEIFNQPHPQPALDGEPYYAGYLDVRGQGNGRGYQFGAPGGTEKDDQFVRSSMYGSFLSGGFAGHVYGAEGIWGADIEPAAPTKMWDAFQWNSGSQMKYLREFAFSIGKRYQELVPLADLVSPNKTHDIRSYEGWAYCARTPDKNIFLAYFEKGCPRSQVRGAKLNSIYRAEWFDPRKGTWQGIAGGGTLRSSVIGIVMLPDFPGDVDWGLRLTYAGPAHP